MKNDGARPTRSWTQGWRVAGWGTALVLLAVPLIAMQFTRDVHWTPSDFGFAATMLGALGLGIELTVRRSSNGYFRAGMACAMLAAFMIVWANAAVGMVGNEDNPVNLLFASVILIALFGAAGTRLRAQGLARVMFVAGTAQIAIASVFGIMGSDVRGGLFSIILAMPWLLAGLMFRAART